MFTLDIITPEKTFFTGEASMVTVPGSEGEFGVLEGHMPFISTLKPGIIRVERGSAEPLRIAVVDGVAEVTATRCVILAETAKSLEDITSADAQADIRHAQEHIDAALNEEQAAKAARELALAKAVAMGF